MVRSNFQLRSVGLALALCIAWSIGCNKQGIRRREGDEMNLNQDVTVTGKPQDVIFKDFGNNWRQFISKNPQLAATVVGTTEHRETAPEPIISPECLYSSSAKGYVPRITITWNEAPDQVVNGRFSRAHEVQQLQQTGQDQVPEMRIDLGLHHEPFTRNYFSSALSSEVSKRFSLPSNSALVTDPEAVRLTGPGLFPQLIAVRTQVLLDAASQRQIMRNTLVMQELSQGLSYQMRISRPAGNQWTSDQYFVFMSPVCQSSF
jgi:hypothetical protein